MNTLYQKIFKFIKNNELIKKGDKLLLAFSGGADSVFTFSFLRKHLNYLGISLGAAHLHHHLRGEEAENDRQFCRKLCREYNIPFYTEDLDVKSFAEENKLSKEEAARFLRYQKLSEICVRYGFDKIVTAHNQNDNTETILLNLIKGTGFDGLTGIPVKRDNIIRPILCVSREEIEKYLKANELDYRTDSTNESNEYYRNFLRNRILPLLKENINPSLDKSIFQTSSILSKLKNIIDEKTVLAIKKYVTENENRLKIDLEFFEEYDIGIFGEILKKKVNEKFGEEFDYNDFEIVLELNQKQVGKYVEISDKVVAVRERNSILIKPKETESFEPVELKIGDKFSSPEFEILIDHANAQNINYSNSNKIEFIDGNEIEGNFILRRWEWGDKFFPLGLKTGKKVSDFLNEQKVPAYRKKQQLVLTNRNNIVWIVGLRIDDKYKVSNETKKLLKLEFRS